jgi:diguanylate cyclase (GGDEF)-like protein/PAS domain S-box-containing protein
MPDDAAQASELPSYEVLRLLYETMNDGVVAFDAQGRIVFCNPAMAMLVGARIEELKGLTAAEAWGGERIELPDETASTGGQFLVQRRDGTHRIVMGRSFFLRTDPPLQIAIYRDVSRWRMAEHTLRALLSTSLSQGRGPFFGKLVAEMVRILGVRYGLVGTLDPEDPKLLHVEASWARTGPSAPFDTRLEGSPCENLAAEHVCHYRAGAWQLFPRDSFVRLHRIEGFVGAPLVDTAGRVVGLIAAMDTRPLQELYDSRMLISLFAAHAALALAQFEAARELVETRERYEALVEPAREGFYLRDLERSGIIFANRTLSQMFGYSQEELQKLDPRDAIAPELRERVSRLVARMAEQRRPHLLRFIAVRKDGSRFIAELLPTVVTYRGRPCLQSTVRDVTEKVRAEQERLLLAKLAACLAGDDTIERIARTVREITLELFEWDAYCFVVRQPGDERRRVIEYVDKIEGELQMFPGTVDAPESVSGPMRRALAGEPVRIDVAEQGTDPTLQPFGDVEHRSQSLLYAPIRTPRGVIGVVSVQSYRSRRYSGEDLAMLLRVADAVAPALERARAEHFVRESEERYRSLVELAPVAIFVLRDGLIRYANPAAVRLLGASSADDLLDVAFLDFVVDKLRPSIEERFEEILSRKGPMPPVEYEVVRMDGRRLTVESREIATSYGGATAVQVVLQDASQHKEALRRIERSEQQLKLLFEQTPMGVIRWGAGFCVEEWNPAAERIFGYTRAEALGRHANELVVPPAAREHVMGVWQALLDKRGGFRSKNVNVTKDGHTIVCEWYNTPLVDAAGKVVAVASMVQDVTDRERMQEALQESVERYFLAVLGSNDGTWDWDLRSNTVYYSPRWKEMLGIEASADLSSPRDWFDRIHPEDRPQFETALARHMQGLDEHLEVEFRIAHAEGHYIWALCRGTAVRDGAGKPLRMAGSLSDITARKTAEEQMMFDAVHDPLTGLANRAVMLAHIDHSMGIARRDLNYNFAVLVLGLDRFKLINDSHGHSAGDELLRAVGKALQTVLRPGDVIARLGGDEFAVLLDNITKPELAVRLVENLLSVFNRPFHLPSGDLYLTASGGLVMANSSYTSAEDILRDADTAMFRAKSLGKDRIEVFTPELRLRAQNRLQLEMDLRRAVEEKQFDVLFQPIVRVADGSVWGFEAILRWHHPQRGVLLPLEFLSIAEETGIILDLGLQVFSMVCQQLAQWIRLERHWPGLVSVNVSVRQLAEEKFLESLNEILRKTAVPTSKLVIELTESTFLADHALVTQAMKFFRDRGLRLAVDDFGSGYSSLGYLQRFNIDILKIDQMFIKAIGTERERPGILQTIVELGHSLSMDIVAEGIENEQQAALIASLKVPYAQGYLYAPPLDAPHAWEFAQTAGPRPGP